MKANSVLFVDDYEAFRSFAELYLQEKYELFLARNGREALSLLQDGREIDVVVTDTNMPIMDGKELVINLKKEFPKMPVILMSAGNYKAWAKENDVLFLPKDFFKQLPKKIEEVLKNNK